MRKRNEALKTKYKVQLGSAFSSKGQERHLARMLQAVALMDKEKWEKAEKILLQLKDKCTSLADTAAIYLLYGMSCEGRGNKEKAAGIYKELLARDAQSTLGWTALGHLYQRYGKPKEAVECFQKALTYDAKNAFAACHMATVLYGMRRYLEAIPTALQALGNDPTLHKAAGVICLSYAALGNEELAKKFFQIAVKAGADEKGLHANMVAHLHKPTGLNKRYFE